jgi:CBS domain-containing protein
MRCEEIMKTNVECISQTDSVQAAARKMRDQNIGFLPVCDDRRQVIGTITDRDLAMRALADDRPAARTPIADVMSHDVISCRAVDAVETAQELMSQHHKSRMICVDDAGQLAGVMSLSDIAQHESAGAVRTLRNVSSREARV